jgi:O-methyltransferase
VGLLNAVKKIFNQKKNGREEQMSDDPFGGKPNPIHLWNDHIGFNKVFHPIIGHSLVDRQRCFMLYQFANHILSLEGEAAEIGVYKGGTAKLLANVFEEKDKTLYLFDTFEGMPETDPEKDMHSKGDFDDTSFEYVRDFLKDSKNIEIHKGFFPDTAEPIKNTTFCFVHIDVDIYKSVMDCCDFFYPRLAKGGIMIFDDYGFLSCPGAKTAVDEFFQDKPEFSCYLPTGQSFVVKI